MSERKGKKIRAALITDLSSTSAPLIPAWTQAGHEIVAIIGHERHRARLRKSRRLARQAPQWSLAGLAARHAPAAPILFVDGKDGWQELAQEVASLEADVLISAFFLTRIPAGFLALFARGGVNLHPALLPQFRGPLPIHHLVATGLQDVHGGVTLHEMTERFDAGAIIARARMPSQIWDDPVQLGAGLAGAAAELVSTALPAWCEGELEAVPQDEDGIHWATVPRQGFEITPEWTLARLRRAVALVSRRPGLRVRAGTGSLRVRGRIVALGPPAGAPPLARGSWSGASVEFDLADARVRVTPVDPVRRYLARLAGRRKWRRAWPIAPCELLIGGGR